MSTDIYDFLAQTKTDVQAVQYNAANAFPRVLVVPAVNIDHLMSEPRWPTALINDGGGQLDEFNHKIWRRRMDITVVACRMRDPWNEVATQDLLDRGEALIAALEYNTTDGIYLISDSDVTPFVTDMGIAIVQKTYTFAYQIQRA